MTRKLTAFNHKGNKLASISDGPVYILAHLLEKQRLAKYVAYFEREYNPKFYVYWSPITRRRYRCAEGEEARFQPVEGPLYLVGFKYGAEVLTHRIKPGRF